MDDIYTTIAGDTWDFIAYKVYGDCRYLVELLEANQAYRETVVFSAGVQIVCPDIAVAVSSELPVWMGA